MSEKKVDLKVVDSNGSTPLALRVPGEHAYATIIRNYLNDIKVDLEKTEVEDEKSIQWTFTSDPGVSVIFRIYRMGDEMFLYFEVALSQLDGVSEASVLRWLCDANARFHYPFRLAVTEQNFVVAQFRVYCDGITPDHCKIRVETLLPFALDIHEKLRRQFGLQPVVMQRAEFDK